MKTPQVVTTIKTSPIITQSYKIEQTTIHKQDIGISKGATLIDHIYPCYFYKYMFVNTNLQIHIIL